MSAPSTNKFIDVQHQFTAHMRNPDREPAPEQIEPRRLAIYKELIFNNIESFIANAFPVIRTLMSDDDWHAMIRDFMIKHQCKTPIFHEIAREFLDYLEHERHSDDDPIFLRELAHYEWVELALSVLDNECEAIELSIDSDVMSIPLKTSPLAWPLVYHFDVHKIGPDYRPQTENDLPVFLLVYRNSHDSITFIELNPVSARLLDLLNEGKTGTDASDIIASQLAHPNPEIVSTSAQSLIKDWIDRGILIAQ